MRQVTLDNSRENAMNQGTQTFNPTISPLGIRRQVISADYEDLSANLLRPLAVMLLIALVTVLAISQFGQLRIAGERASLAQLQTVRHGVGSENIRLKKVLKNLDSKQRMEAVAAVRLQLYTAQPEQLHSL